VSIRPFLKTSICSLLALLLSSCVNNPQWTPTAIESAATTRPSSAPSAIVVPMQLLPSHLPAVVLGHYDPSADPKQIRFVSIDTGAYISMVTEAFTKERRYATAQSSTHSVDAFGQIKYANYIAHVPSLQIGDATLEKFDAVVVTLPSMQDYGSSWAGVVGAPVFRNVMVTFDYPHRRLIFEPGASLDPANGKDIFPLKCTPDGRMLVQMKIIGQDTWLMIDTGYTGAGLMLSQYQLIGIPWAALPVEGPPVRAYLSTRPLRVGRMNGQIPFGMYTLRQPMLAVTEKDDQAVIGYDVLRHFAVTLDQKNGRVRFTSVNGQSTIDFAPVRRLDFRCDRDGTVKHLPAESGSDTIVQSDRVIQVDQYPVEKLSYRHWEFFEQRGQPLDVRVMREGKQLSFRVPVQVVVP
jgi:predicted aspartyl protease